MKYTDEQRIEKIAVTTGRLLDYLEQDGITREDVMEQETVRWTVTTPLYHIGEQAYYLSDEYKAEHPDIPWAKISGMRHRLVHDYDDTNWGLVCRVLFEILPDFLRSVEELRQEKQP